MLRKFRFFQGMVGASIVSIGLPMETVRITQPRYPRTPIGLIPYPEECDHPGLRQVFRNGWRACERGMDVFDNPYAHSETMIYSMHIAWERGYIECYLRHSSRNR